MKIESHSGPLTKALNKNSTLSTLPTLSVTGEEPVGDKGALGTVADGYGGCFTAGGDGAISQNGICVVPYAEGEPGGEFWVQVWGWRRLGKDASSNIWVPVQLATLFCITGSQSGFTNRLIGVKEYFATVIQSYAGSARVWSPSDGNVGYATVPLLGCQKFQFQIAQGQQGPAFGNALWAFI